MTKVTAWGEGWSGLSLCLVRPLDEAEARHRRDRGERTVARILTDDGILGCVIEDLAAGHVEVRLHAPVEGISRMALHYGAVTPGHCGLIYVSCTGGEGSEPKWVQIVQLDGGRLRAVLEVPPAMARYEESLRESRTHVDLAGMRFDKPAFGEYGHLVRADLGEMAMLDLARFDPDLVSGSGPAVSRGRHPGT